MGKTALVTGAAGGIGRACAMRLAREGMAVAVLDIDLDGCRRVVSEIEKPLLRPVQSARCNDARDRQGRGGCG